MLAIFYFSYRQENVNYMGYFSTHEELMNNIMMEQVDIVKLHIKRVVDRAMVDCRRDYLWERLQKGNRDSEDSGRRRKEDPREMACVFLLRFFESYPIPP